MSFMSPLCHDRACRGYPFLGSSKRLTMMHGSPAQGGWWQGSGTWHRI